MTMIISQEYMETYVISPLARRLAEIEAKIDKLLEKEIACECAEKPETKTIKKVK